MSGRRRAPKSTALRARRSCSLCSGTGWVASAQGDVTVVLRAGEARRFSPPVKRCSVCFMATPPAPAAEPPVLDRMRQASGERDEIDGDFVDPEEMGGVDGSDF